MPQKISGTKDVHFFSVGVLQGRTLIVYMKKKGVRFTLNFKSERVSSTCRWTVYSVC